ncbi:MAG TPA: hypothetical protein VHL52_04590 [Acidimicrobiia bacterium]|nr:hypothetical protein [Acidimicrobiia bacterium]
MDEERDVEIFERIPWESLEPRPDRQWIAYLLAGIVVLGAVGISLGRQMAAAPPAPLTVTTTALAPDPVPPASVTTDTVTTETVATVPEPATTWSEADLMALPVSSLETSAAALAEWFIVEYFTREEDGGSRSYVDWAETSQVEWTDTSSAEVTVLVRRLAAGADEAYQRLEAEAWKVETNLDDTGWTVVGGPIQAEPPEMALPDRGGGVEWTDGAGISWTVHESDDAPD